MKGASGGTTHPGLNRTGFMNAPGDSREMLRGAERLPVSALVDGHLAEVRESYVAESEPIGSVPPPASLGGMVQAASEMLKGLRSSVLLDKMSERLSFERGATRLYEAVLAKLDALGTWDGGPDRQDLEEIHLDELSHVALLTRAITAFGGDPTVQTPSADLHGVASFGILQVVSDPRTDLRANLEAVLVAELADNEGWDTLATLVGMTGQDEILEDVEHAREEEQRHLERLRTWLAAALEKDAAAFGRLRRRSPPASSRSGRSRAATKKAPSKRGRAGGSPKSRRASATTKRTKKRSHQRR